MAFAHKPQSMFSLKYVISISADFLQASGLDKVKGFSVERLRSGWVRIAAGDDFKPRAKHQLRQIHLYTRQMRQLHDFGNVLPFQAIKCMAVIGHGHLDLRLPTTAQVKRAERKVA
jgi:hypothetical protein